MKIIGLTGGLGSGKSAAASCFAEQGLPVIDADSIGHALIARDKTIQEALHDMFGAGIFSEGAVSREKLAARVFSDDDARRRLNALLHPAIMESVSQRCASLGRAGHSAVIVEAALLGESGRREPWLAGLILVRAPSQLRLDRLVRDRGMTADEVMRRMAAQSNPDIKISIADWIIDNSGDREALCEQARAIAADIQGLPG